MPEATVHRTDTGTLTADQLAEVIANLDAYIQGRAEQLAKTAVAREKDRADRRIRDVRAKLLAELRREKDLAAELRRQLKPAVRNADRYFAEAKELRDFQRRLLAAAEQWKERGYLYEACGLAVDDLMKGGDGYV